MTFWLCEPVPIAKAGEDRRTEIERLADEASPAIARAVRQALETQIAAIDLDALEAALRRGDQGEVMRIVGAIPPAAAGAITAALEDAVWTAGAATARAPALTEAQFVFQRLNPGLVSWLQNYSLNLIREIDKGTVESVRGALLDGMRAGANPIETARSIRESVGLTERQSNAVRAYRRQLEQIHTGKGVKAMGLGLEIDRVNGRQVFKPDEDGAPKDGIRSRRLRDFRYDPTLQRAVATGKALTKAQIDKMVDAYRRKYLRHRSEVIARTESIRANNAGAAEAWRQAVASGQVDGALVRKRWIVGADERACRVCLEIPRMNPKQGIPIDALFATPIGPLAAPVAHPNCRCSLSYRIFEPSQLQENTP